MRFDPLLTRQLERFNAHVARGISNSDQEFVKQVVSVLGDLSLASLESRSYFAEQGENSVTTFISAHLNSAIQDAAGRKLDNVALEGADRLRDLCQALIGKQLYVSALTQVSNLEQLATVSLLNARDIVLSVAVRGLSDCLLHNCIHGLPGTHLTSHLLESLMRIMRARLASPLGLDMTKVSYSVGPFISITEHSSFGAINVALANGIIQLSRSNQRDELARLMSVYEELHYRAWLDFAELGVEAVKRNSFLLHYVNSTIETTVGTNFRLVSALDLPRIEERSWEAAREQDRRDRFREEIKNKIRWETTGIYSRIIPAMFEHRQLTYLSDTIKKQALFGFWAMRVQVEEVADEAAERIFRACAQLQDPKFGDVYASARLAVHIAQIGIAAIASGSPLTLKKALERYSTLRRTFRDQYPDEHFVGDFESAEHDLLEQGRRGLLLDSHDQEFFSRVTPEQVRTFFASLQYGANSA